MGIFGGQGRGGGGMRITWVLAAVMTAGDFICLGHGLKGSFLVRDCYIAANEFRRRQICNDVRGVLWLNCFFFIDSVDAITFQPIGVNERRA